MKIPLAAAALALLLPAAAHAQAGPDPKAETACCCCEKMDRKMACCEMHRKDKGQEGEQGSDAHKGHGSGH